MALRDLIRRELADTCQLPAAGTPLVVSHSALLSDSAARCRQEFNILKRFFRLSDFSSFAWQDPRAVFVLNYGGRVLESHASLRDLVKTFLDPNYVRRAIIYQVRYDVHWKKSIKGSVIHGVTLATLRNQSHDANAANIRNHLAAASRSLTTSKTTCSGCRNQMDSSPGT